MLRLELNVVQIGGIVKNKKFESKILGKIGATKASTAAEFSEETVLEAAYELLE